MAAIWNLDFPRITRAGLDCDAQSMGVVVSTG
jgi:hypothetical protein